MNSQKFSATLGALCALFAVQANAQTLANPTATIGLSVVNGSATSGMRSDGAPPLSQAIVPTWTGSHTFTGGVNVGSTLHQYGAFAILGDFNTATYPAPGSGLASSWNFTGGDGEADLWSIYTGAPTGAGFAFKQVTGTNTATNLMRLYANGKVQLPGLKGGPTFTDASGNLASQPGCVAIESYGGVADGTPTTGTFNDTALANAVAASNTVHAGYPCVKFGTGTYRFASNFAYTVPYIGSIVFEGQGSQATRLQWASGVSAISLTQTHFSSNTLSTFHFRHLTIATEGQSTSTVGLTLNGVGLCGAYPTSEMLDTSFEGSDGHGGVNYWGRGISIIGWSGVNVFGGHLLNGAAKAANTIGVLIQGNITQQACGFNMSQTYIGFYDVGIQYSNYTQGVTIHQVNLLGCSYGVFVPSGATGTLSELIYTNNQSNCSVAQLFINTATNPVQISNNLFEAASGAGSSGIVMTTHQNSTITGNVLLGQGGTGIAVSGAASGAMGIIADNVFSGFGTAVNLIGSAGWIVHDNKYSSPSGCAACATGGNFNHDDH